MVISAFDAGRRLAAVTDGVQSLDGCVQLLADSFPAPMLVELHGSWLLRHRLEQQNALLLSFLKLVKIASHNNAALVLLNAGYVQEVYALCRMIFEACDEILHMRDPAGEDGQATEKQRHFLRSSTRTNSRALIWSSRMIPAIG